MPCGEPRRSLALARARLRAWLFSKKNDDPHSRPLKGFPNLEVRPIDPAGDLPADDQEGGERTRGCRERTVGSLGAGRRFLHDTYDSDKRYCPCQVLCMSNAIIERVSRLVPAGPVPSRLVSSRFAGFAYKTRMRASPVITVEVTGYWLTLRSSGGLPRPHGSSARLAAT